jgi:hypothetical protein
VRDDLPDLLWPVLVLSEYGTHGAQRFVRWQKDVQVDLSGQAEARFLAECLDGRLTGLDRLAGQVPEAKGAVVRHAEEHGLLLDSISNALAIYPEAPSPWLFDLDLTPPNQVNVDLLARAIAEVLKDGHREAVIKCLPIWSAVQAGTFSSSHQTIELLKTYPEDVSTRGKADSAVRAMWGGGKSVLLHNDPGYFDASVKWAKVFWGFNSMITRCVRRRDNEPEGEAKRTGMASDGESDEQVIQKSEVLHQNAMDLTSSYVEALETAPARLWDPERQEVHAGLVFRAARDVITVLGAPDLWCSEHGAHISRMLVETRITLRWMAVQDNPSIYKKYKDYGAGKAKLYARVTAELPEEWLLPHAGEAIDELERLSHNDETNSGIAHSEWWSIEMHCMERCRNVLHRGHLIPSLALSGGANEDLARAWVIALYGLIRESLAILDTDADAVDAAFDWLETETSGEDVPEGG